MAGVKITDLGTLTTAVNEDLLYIVDVSDTSQSPQGTSKQIEVGNMFSSGTWLPVVSDITNDAIIDLGLDGLYSRVGSVVTCSFTAEITIDAAFIDTFFEITIPIPSAFSGSKSAWGTNNTTKYTDLVGVSILSSGSKISIYIEATNSYTSTFQFVIQYIIE
jgi:hypothetical protein